VTATGVEHVEVAIIGAGFGGLATAYQLAGAGIDDVVIFERSNGVGGTWRQNHYPGAACDVPSHLYSLSFAPNPDWSRTYASQPEILQYIEDCYDRFDLRRRVRCATEIHSMAWDGDRHLWRLSDRNGERYEARIVVSAIGLFHTPSVPDLPGLDAFAGTAFHSARWDHDHDLTGRRVAVIGTGASAVQIVPAIAEQAGRVDVYQRTPAWVLPRKDEPYSDEQRRIFADRPEVARQLRDEQHDAFESATTFFTGDPTGAAIEMFARDYLARKVPDPELRARLTPDYPIGCKRALVSSAFYSVVQRDDVELVTSRIERIGPGGIRTVDGTERPCDTIVLCTGFHAAEYLRGIAVTGRDGTDLHRRWARVPRAYHGLAVPGFPNLFLLYGPNTNQGGNSIVLILEAQARFVAEALRAMQEEGATAVEVRTEAMARYVEDLTTALEGTVWNGGCDSYFRAAGGEVVTQLPHTSGQYRLQIERFPTGDFELSGGLSAGHGPPSPTGAPDPRAEAPLTH
jgi:cation diffusion facilitator CzcD-associated flavoprotein CzcO